MMMLPGLQEITEGALFVNRWGTNVMKQALLWIGKLKIAVQEDDQGVGIAPKEMPKG